MEEVPQDPYVYVHIDLYITAHFILSIHLSFLFLPLTQYKRLKTFIKPDCGVLVCQCTLTVVCYIGTREATVKFSATVYKFPTW